MREMRRQDRKLTVEESTKLLLEGEYGVLATVMETGEPYSVPLSYAYDPERNAIYFHGTSEHSQKKENLRYQNTACMTVVTKTELLPERFGTKYWSVNVFGKVFTVDDPSEKRHGIEAILRKYSGDYWDAGMKYIDSAIDKISVLKMDITEMTGKARQK